MRKAKATLYNITRSHRDAVKTALHQALEHSDDYDVDGVIIIVTTSKRRHDPFTLRAGLMTQSDRAMQQLYRLHLELAVGAAGNDALM